MSAVRTDQSKKRHKGFYCPISRSWIEGKTYYILPFEIGKRGNTTNYDNVSELAKLILNAPDSIDKIEALKELKQYKDKHITLSFEFHTWRKQGNAGLLKFVNVNKAFGEYISKFKMKVESVTKDVEKNTWKKLFEAIKYNCLHHKLDTIEFRLYNKIEEHSQIIYNGIMDLINCESKLTKLSVSDIPHTFLLHYIQIYFLYLINIINCYEIIIDSLQKRLIPNDIIKLILEQRGKRDKLELTLASEISIYGDKLQFDEQKVLTEKGSGLMRQICLLINKYDGIFNIDIKSIDYSENAIYTMLQFDQYMTLFFEHGTELTVNKVTLFCE